MRKKFGLTVLFLLVFLFLHQVRNCCADDNFQKIVSRYGAELWKHNTEEIYVQVVDLDKGASVKFFIDYITESGGVGVFGGDNPKFNKKDLRDFWDDEMSLLSQSFSLTNGVHFEDMFSFSTELTYPVKINSWISGGVKNYQNGFENSVDSGLKMFELSENPQRASIKVVDKNMYLEGGFSDAPNVLVGWHVDPSPDSSEKDYRYMLGLKNGDINGQYNTVLILTAKSLTIPEAVDVLMSFGVEDNNSNNNYEELQIVALDSGGSTQLMAINSNNERQEYIRQSRNVPQSIGVFSAPSPTEQMVIKFDDSNIVYLYSNNRLWPIKNEMTYIYLGFRAANCDISPDWDKVIELPAQWRDEFAIRSEIIGVPGLPPDRKISYRLLPSSCSSSLADSSKLYALVEKDGQTKFHHIDMDFNEYVDMGFDANSMDIVYVSWDLFNYHGEGEAIDASDSDFWITTASGGSDSDYVVNHSAITGAIINEMPTGKSDNFYNGDDYVGIWLELADVYDSLNIEWKWHKPNGELFGERNYITDWPTNVYWPDLQVWRFLDISNLTDYGQWKVEIYINANKVDTQFFTLSSSGGGGGGSSSPPPAISAPINLRIAQ